MTGKTAAARRDDGIEAAGPFEAAVLRVEDGRVAVRAIGAGISAEDHTARVAIPGYAPAPGDRVLVQRAAGSGGLFVIGVAHAAGAPSIATKGGAGATVRGETVTIHDAAGAVVASYDAATGELHIAATGDLRLSAPAGRVVVEGAGGVRLASGNGETASAIEIQGGAVAVRGETTRISAAELAVDASAASFAVGHWELRAERVVERVTDALRTVDGLLETRAKRLRTLVDSTLELFGKRTTITSEKDTRIDGQRVLLG